MDATQVIDWGIGDKATNDQADAVEVCWFEKCVYMWARQVSFVASLSSPCYDCIASRPRFPASR